jgi:hypothetical protein
MVTAAKDRLTGPGQIEKLPDGSTLLFNYDIDSTAIKPEHAKFLDQNIVAAAKQNPNGLRVVIGGTADRLGDAGHNVVLSNRRIEAVVAFLKRRMPNYPWDFQGFGAGVGESTAERAGEKDDTRSDIFRSVIIEILKPGQPIPPAPSIPRSFPKKPGSFPKPIPRRPPSRVCVTERDCPFGEFFTIQLLVGLSGGEIVEAGVFGFLIVDTLNKLEAVYTLTSGGLGTPGLPVNVSLVGKPSQFRTRKAVKVTNFGPVGAITSATVPVGPGGSVPITLFSILNFNFHNSGSLVAAGSVFISDFDTGPVSIPGAGIQLGRLKLETVCRGGPGASNSELFGI